MTPTVYAHPLARHKPAITNLTCRRVALTICVAITLCGLATNSEAQSSPPVLVSDTFTGTDGTPLPNHPVDASVVGATWTAFSGSTPSLSSGTSSSPEPIYYDLTAVNAKTADVRIAVDAYLANGLADIAIRATDDQHYLLIQAYGGWLRIFKRTPAGFPLIAGAGASTNPGSTHHIEVRAEGSAIEAWYDGVCIIQITETYQQNATWHGLVWPNYDYGARFDNLEIRGPMPPITHASIMPGSLSLGVRSTESISVQGYDATNTPMPSPWTWSSANPAIATVSTGASNTASVFGTGLGTTTITAQALNGVTTTVSVTVVLGDVLVYDSFTGTNGTPLPQHAPDLNPLDVRWLPIGPGWTIPKLQNGQVVNTADVLYSGSVVETATSDIRLVVQAHLTSGLAQAIVRATDADHYLLVQAYDSWLRIFKKTPAGFNLIGYAGASTNAGSTHTLEVRTAGSTVEGWWDGVQIIQITEAYQQQATRHGLMWPPYDANGTFDNFEVHGIVPVVSRVAVTPSSSTVSFGGSQTFTAQAFDAADNPMASAFHWTISDPAAAEVTAPGVFAKTMAVRGVIANATVTATAVSGATGTAALGVSSSGILVYDSFTGAINTPLPVHTPEINSLGQPWTAMSSASPTLQANGVSALGQTDPLVGAALDTGATDVTVGVDWRPADAIATSLGFPLGLVVLRVQDSSNFLVAGFGLDGYPIGVGKYMNGAFFVLRSATLPPSVAGITSRHLEVSASGTHIGVSVDGSQVIDMLNADYADQTRHGMLWKSWDVSSQLDNFSVRGVPRCVTSVTSSATSIDHLGDQLVLTITAPPTCMWAASTDSDWLPASLSAGSGTGSGTALVGVARNFGDQRSGHVVVGGHVVIINQQERPNTICAAGLSPDHNSTMAANGGSSNFDVNVAASYCEWGAWSNVPWIYLVSAQGSGSGQVTYVANPNLSGGPRSGTITVYADANAATFTVTQLSNGGGSGGGGSGGGSAQSSTVVASPGVVRLPNTWRSGSVALLTPQGNSWIGTTTASWLAIDSASGEGSATVWYAAAENTTGVERSAEVVFYDSQTSTKVVVVQRPTPATTCGDFDCDGPPADDCGWGGGPDPGSGGGVGGGNHDPWCDDMPAGSADPHCRAQAFTLPTHTRLQLFGETSMCVGPAPAPPSGLIKLQCRDAVNSFAEAVGSVHCYFVTRDEQGTPTTTEGREEQRHATGRLVVVNDNFVPVTPDQESDPMYFEAQGTNVFERIACIKLAAININSWHLPYFFLGPNSNSVIATISQTCNINARLPDGAIGKNILLVPPFP